MIHSARAIVTPVANIVSIWKAFEHLKSGDGRTDNMCENNDPYRPWLWVVRVDQWGSHKILNLLFSAKIGVSSFAYLIPYVYACTCLVKSWRYAKSFENWHLSTSLHKSPGQKKVYRLTRIQEELTWSSEFFNITQYFAYYHLLSGNMFQIRPASRIPFMDNILFLEVFPLHFKIEHIFRLA